MASNNTAATSSAKKPRSTAAMSSGSSAYQEVSSPPSAVSHLPALLYPTTADSYSYDGGGAGRHNQQQHVSCYSPLLYPLSKQPTLSLSTGHREISTAGQSLHSIPSLL
ncbi:unnamed protein product [Linum trigynum]|uniref:Uncharacterized protein n=1 Tax=Linum trigynum TaxID=586398 RepID=A0AAV2CNS2_9ROSI